MKRLLHLLCLTAVGCSPPAASADDDRIVFVSDRDGTPALYTMSMGDRTPARLVETVLELRAPTPAGAAHVIAEARTGRGCDLVEIELATGAITPLTRSGRASEPDVSPNGARIAFTQDDGEAGSAIMIMSRDGTNPTRASPEGARDRAPAWSPDGRRLAFSTVIDRDEHVFVMDADGGSRTRLTETAGENSMPAWSPDGAWIVFNHARSDVHDAITITRADGSDRSALGVDANLRTKYMDRNTASWGPIFSPDGRTIVFTSVRTGNAELWRMDADGKNVRRLTSNRAQDLEPAWLPAR